VQTTAATAFAAVVALVSASMSSRSCGVPCVAHHATNAPVNASPAPIVSTTSTAGAATCVAPRAVTTRAPAAPAVRSTALAPRRSTAAAASAGSSSGHK
jgi:hypothetical protein